LTLAVASAGAALAFVADHVVDQFSLHVGAPRKLAENLSPAQAVLMRYSRTCFECAAPGATICDLRRCGTG
jgi:hypothetical protein